MEFIEKKLNEADDAELVSLTLENKQNYRYLIERYDDKLGRYVARISRARKEEIEDILQNVFLKAYKNLNNFDKSLKFSSWIYRIAHNETVDHIKKWSNRPKIQSIDEEVFKNTLSEDAKIEEDLDKKAFAKKIGVLIDSLEEKYREVMVLRYIEEKDYQEIADILRKPVGTVSTLINRAKKQLKTQIENDPNLEIYARYI